MSKLEALYQSYLNKIKPHLGKINNIIQQMGVNQPLSQLHDAGFSARFTDNAIAQDRKKYFFKDRAQTIATTLRTNFPQALKGRMKILDVGCGYGEYMEVLAALGHEVFGTNHNQYSEDFLFVNNLLGHPVVLHDLKEGLPFANNSFDAIICYGVVTLKCFAGMIPQIVEELNRVSRKYVAIRLHEKTLHFHNLTSPYGIAPKNVKILVSNQQDITWQLDKRYNPYG